MNGAIHFHEESPHEHTVQLNGASRIVRMNPQGIFTKGYFTVFCCGPLSFGVGSKGSSKRKASIFGGSLKKDSYLGQVHEVIEHAEDQCYGGPDKTEAYFLQPVPTMRVPLLGSERNSQRKATIPGGPLKQNMDPNGVFRFQRPGCAWDLGVWSPCSATSCGGLGSRVRSVGCRSQHGDAGCRGAQSWLLACGGIGWRLPVRFLGSGWFGLSFLLKRVMPRAEGRARKRGLCGDIWVVRC